jgi:pantetheine-phosphate adenylyltransferase
MLVLTGGNRPSAIIRILTGGGVHLQSHWFNRRNHPMSTRKIAVYPGSFDPVTLGHLDIIRRGAAMFDRLVVAVANNPDKRSLFTIEERMAMVRAATKGLRNVVVDAYEGLTAAHVAELKATAILRGLRQHSDFEYEYQLALANRTISGIETVFVMADERVAYISSHLVREVAALGGDISRFVPPAVAKAVRKMLQG